MFNISSTLRKKDVNHTITPKELAIDDQKWMDLLQSIRGHKDPLGNNPNAESFQSLLLDLSKAFLILLSKETAKELRSDIASIADFLGELVSRFLERDPLSWTATQEQCFSLLSFIMWVTYSQDVLLREPPTCRESILNVLERFVLSPATSSALKVERANNRYTERPNISLNYARHRLMIRPPALHVVAQLCTTMRYKCVATLASSTQSERPDGGSIRTYDFNDDWKRSVFLDYPRNTNGNLGPNNRRVIISHGYTSGTFQGLWEGAFFAYFGSNSVFAQTPFIIKWDSPDMNQESDICTCEMAMQYHIREFHSFDVEETVYWSEEDTGGISQARAWFPERMEWYESLLGLVVYDSTKDRWIIYHPFSPSKDAGQIVDTIIVGTSVAIPGSDHGEYKIHGRVRREDGLVALVRQPVLTTSDFLGTWLFEGHVLGGREFVGDWRVTSRAAYSPGEQGWFTLTKACEDGACVAEVTRAS